MAINGRTYKRTINEIKQEITLGVYDWGIYVMIENKHPQRKNKTYMARRFKFCKSSPRYEDIVKRIEKFYNLTEKDLKN